MNDISKRSLLKVAALSAVAAAAARPCIVLAGQVLVGSREMRAMGVESAYGVTERVDLDASMAEPARHLADLAERVARTWSPRRLG